MAGGSLALSQALLVVVLAAGASSANQAMSSPWAPAMMSRSQSSPAAFARAEEGFLSLRQSQSSQALLALADSHSVGMRGGGSEATQCSADAGETRPQETLKRCRSFGAGLRRTRSFVDALPSGMADAECLSGRGKWTQHDMTTAALAGECPRPEDQEEGPGPTLVKQRSSTPQHQAAMSSSVVF